MILQWRTSKLADFRAFYASIGVSTETETKELQEVHHEQKNTIILAIKAVILAEGAGCTVDEAIRYLVAVCITNEAEHVRISIMTDILLSKVRKLVDADSTVAVY